MIEREYKVLLEADQDTRLISQLLDSIKEQIFAEAECK